VLHPHMASCLRKALSEACTMHKCGAEGQYSSRIVGMVIVVCALMRSPGGGIWVPRERVRWRIVAKGVLVGGVRHMLLLFVWRGV
jgi:hypothetical protein